jgi:uncharacterized protein (DUF3820 family)
VRVAKIDWKKAANQTRKRLEMKRALEKPFVVPFGKYRGKPYDVLLADRPYCSWLLSQTWFSGKLRNIIEKVNK